jgi:hypothetical protein
VVPNAVVEALDSSWEALRGSTTTSALVREQARARTHRLLAQRPAFVDKFIGVGIAAGALVRGLGRFVRKSGAPFAEYAGVLAASFALASLSRARRSVRAARVQPIEGARLFVPQSVVAQRRALAREEAIAAQEGAESTTTLRWTVAASWWFAFALLAGFVLAAPLLGAEALAGGAALPLPATIESAWSAIGATWTEVAGGTSMAPDGFASFLGMLATLTWWDPNALIVGLFVLAIPMSFVAGYVGAGALTTSSRTAIVVGGIWAVVPTLHSALGEGRIPAVIAHILLPFAVRAIAGRSIVSLGWAALLIAGVWAAVPSLAPIIVVVVLVRAITGVPAAILVVLPALALEWPRLLESLSSPLTYFADRGLPTPVETPTGFGVLALWPTAVNLPIINDTVATVLAVAAVAAAVTFVAIAVVVAENARVGLVALIAGVALVEIAAFSEITLASANGQPVSVFTGPLLDVVWFALATGSAITLTSLRRSSTVLGPIAVATVAAVGIVPLTAVALGTATVHPSTVRTLPAYVEAQTAVDRGAGTLVLTPTDAGLIVSMERDGGTTLLDWSATVATRRTITPAEESLGNLAANLVVESSVDVTAAAKESRIAFVLLKDVPTATEVSMISSHAGLVLVGETDRGILWRVLTPIEAAPTDRAPNVVYLVVLAVIGIIALIAAVPTSMPRRRPAPDDVIPLDEEADDDRS